jgi:hypothetical protein
METTLQQAASNRAVTGLILTEMACIKIPQQNQLPGSRGLMAFRPDTAVPLNFLAEALLTETDNVKNILLIKKISIMN